MLRHTFIKGSRGTSTLLSSLFRQLHISGNNGRYDMLEKARPFMWSQSFPKKPGAIAENNQNDTPPSKTTLLTSLHAQAIQGILENPFQYTIRPSIGIPPDMIRRPEYRTPVSHSVITPLEIPGNQNSQDKEIKDSPSSTIVEKQAARLIVIRRIKMNKHKLRKLRKKMKYAWAKVRLRRATRKEKAYLNSKMELINAARNFDAKTYVAGIIKKAKEEPLPYKWTDPLMPDWFREQEMKKEAWQKRYQKMINLYVNKPITIDFTEKKK